MREKKPKLDTARMHLEKLCTAGSGTRLPPVAELASCAGVGLGTMWRAVRSLVASGNPDARPRRGIHVRFPVAAASAAANDGSGLRPAWRRIAAQLREKMEQGSFDTLPALPIPKQLCAITGANYRTVRKALQHLATEGLVRPSGRGWVVSQWNRPGSTKRVLLIAPGTAAGELSLPTFRSRHHFFLLESICSAAKAELEVLAVPFGGPGTHTDILGMYGDMDGWHRLTGVIVWTAGLSPERLSDIMRFCSVTDQPVGLLDEREPPADLEPFLTSGRLRCFSMGHSERDAAIMGDYVLHKGHTGVLFIGYDRLHCGRNSG